MKKIITNILAAASILLIVWALLSWVDIVADNSSPNPSHNPCNLFVLLFDENEPTPTEGQCGDPLSTLRVDMAGIEIREDDYVIFQTDDGNTWKVEPWKIEDFSTDGYYVVMFDTMGTDTIEDDQIIKVFREIW